MKSQAWNVSTNKNIQKYIKIWNKDYVTQFILRYIKYMYTLFLFFKLLDHISCDCSL